MVLGIPYVWQNEFWMVEKKSKLSTILCVNYYIECSSKDGMEGEEIIKWNKNTLWTEVKCFNFKNCTLERSSVFLWSWEFFAHRLAVWHLTVIQTGHNLFGSQTPSQEKGRSAVVFYESLHHWEATVPQDFLCAVYNLFKARQNSFLYELTG